GRTGGTVDAEPDRHPGAEPALTGQPWVRAAVEASVPPCRPEPCRPEPCRSEPRRPERRPSRYQVRVTPLRLASIAPRASNTDEPPSRSRTRCATRIRPTTSVLSIRDATLTASPQTS